MTTDKRYLRIATLGVCEIEAFTVLGASSARNEEGKIGQFGSGAKHAILCALRAGVGLLIYCGKTRIVPQTQPQRIHGIMQERVQFRIDNRTELSSMTLDFGSLDWTQPVSMMLRELISNALDQVNGEWSKLTLDYVDRPRASKDRTQVFVELTDDVRTYVTDTHKYFLHVSGEQSKKLLPQKPMPARFYRKGVFVHEIGDSSAIYSYNCGDELAIDESRNLDTDRVRNYSAQILSADLDATKHVLRLVVEGYEGYEAELSKWYLDYSTVAKACRELYGEDVTICSDELTHSKGLRKGLNSVRIPRSGWYGAAEGGGIPTTISKLCKADSEGLTLFPASDTLVENTYLIWDSLEACGLTGGKDFSSVSLHEFESPMNAGTQRNGYYDSIDNAIGIHRDSVDNWQVIIEEIAHFLTGAGDATRDFQDYAFRLSAILMRKLLDKQRHNVTTSQG